MEAKKKAKSGVKTRGALVVLMYDEMYDENHKKYAEIRRKIEERADRILEGADIDANFVSGMEQMVYYHGNRSGSQLPRAEDSERLLEMLACTEAWARAYLIHTINTMKKATEFSNDCYRRGRVDEKKLDDYIVRCIEVFEHVKTSVAVIRGIYDRKLREVFDLESPRA